MGITLTSKTINSTYDSLLKLSDNDSLTGAFKVITDGLGNDTGCFIKQYWRRYNKRNANSKHKNKHTITSTYWWYWYSRRIVLEC